MNFASMLLGETPSLPKGKTRTYMLLNEPDQRPRGRHSRIKAEAMRKMVIKAMRSGCDEYASIQKHIGISASSVKRQVDYLVDKGLVCKTKCNLLNGHFKWRFALL